MNVRGYFCIALMSTAAYMLLTNAARAEQSLSTSVKSQTAQIEKQDAVKNNFWYQKQEEPSEGIGNGLYKELQERLDVVEQRVTKFVPFETKVSIGRNTKLKSKLNGKTTFEAEIDIIKPSEANVNLEYRLSKQWSIRGDLSSDEGFEGILSIRQDF